MVFSVGTIVPRREQVIYGGAVLCLRQRARPAFRGRAELGTTLCPALGIRQGNCSYGTGTYLPNALALFGHFGSS